MSVASKLQIRPEQSVCVIGRPQDASLDLGPEPELVQDPGASDALVKPEGVRPVRQIAIDDVWSALRLRPD